MWFVSQNQNVICNLKSKSSKMWCIKSTKSLFFICGNERLKFWWVQSSLFCFSLLRKLLIDDDLTAIVTTQNYMANLQF